MTSSNTRSGLIPYLIIQTALRKMKEKQTLIVGAGLQLFLRKWGEVLLSVWIGGSLFFGWSSRNFGRSQFKHINPVHLQPCWSKWLSFMTWPVTRPRIRRSSHPVVDIPFPLVVGARSILIWMGRVSRGTYGRPFGCLGNTNKEKTNSNHIPYHLKPILTKGGNIIIYLSFSFPLIPPDNQAALPSNKWLRVSKQPWPLGRRFAAPFLSGPAAVRHLNSKLRSDPIGSDPFRFHRSSRWKKSLYLGGLRHWRIVSTPDLSWCFVYAPSN